MMITQEDGMRKMLGVVAVAVVLTSASVLNAGGNAAAGGIIDIAGSRASYDIKTVEGEDLVITADYARMRPDPEIENIDIAPRNPSSEGTRVFRIMTREGVPIEIQYLYAGDKCVEIKISAEPSNTSSDAEHSQVLSVEARSGHIINFTFIWQGKELREVRIEPMVNPFAS